MQIQSSQSNELANYDENKFKVLTWKNIGTLHWIVNPGLAFNELVLGQRIPKVVLVEKDSKKPLSEKTFIPCPYCNILHSGTKWTTQNKTAFKNWFGYYCDNCEQIIPCVMNLTSYLILGITLPFWYFFKDSWKAKWLATQKSKFSQPMFLTAPKVKWWKAGFNYGASMFVVMAIFNYLILGKEVFFDIFLIGIILYTIAGILFGLILKLTTDSKSN